MTRRTAMNQGLNPVFPESHPMGERIFWDPYTQSYYDSSTDLFISSAIVEAWNNWIRPKDMPQTM